MSEIYAVRNDGFDYQSLDLTLLDIVQFAPNEIDPEADTEFGIESHAMGSWWKTPKTKFINTHNGKNLGIPDISTWLGASLVLSPKAYNCLHEILRYHGEFLPVHVDNETYYIFNCHTLGEEDLDQCHFESIDNSPVQLYKLKFNDSAKSLISFKSRCESFLTLFCNEHLKKIVEEYALTGVVFDTELVENY